MSKRIITISREFGSGGRYIGQLLAEELGYKYYDKNLIEKVAKETGFDEEYIEKRGEYANGSSLLSYIFSSRTSTGMSVDDYVFNAQKKIIKEIADGQPCVIVGRCADFILRDRDDVLDVFIMGEMPEKIKRVCKSYDVDQIQAEKMIKDMDKKREINYQYCTERKWAMSKNYDLCLNSSQIGYEGCVAIIKKFLA